MSTETEAPHTPDSIDAAVFWIENKRKILTYAIAIVVLLTLYGAYQLFTQRQLAESQEAYANAKTEAELQGVIEKFAGSRVAGNASLTLADKQREAKKYDDAIKTLRDFIDKNPEHPLVAGAWTSLGVTYEMQGKLDEALDAYQQVASKYPEAYTTPISMISQARILLLKGKSDDARRLYQDVASRFPDTVFARQAASELRFLKRQ